MYYYVCIFILQELVITHLLNKERLVSVFEMMGKWQEDSESIESSPSPCTPNEDQSGMNEESLATVDLESPPGSPKAKPRPVIPLPDQEPEQLLPTPNEAMTNPKLAQLRDMFPEEDIKKLTNLLRVCGGDVTRAVDAMLSGQVPDVPQGETYVPTVAVHLMIELEVHGCNSNIHVILNPYLHT